MLSEQAKKLRAGLRRYRPSQDLQAERAGWEAWAATQPLPDGINETMTSMGGVAGRLLAPDGNDDDALIIYFHGGGLVSGASITHRAFCCKLALAVDQSIFVVDYRRLPEADLNSVLSDGLAVLTAPRTARRLSVCADSSGAALALASMQKMRDQQKQLPDRAVFFSPALDATLLGNSFVENADRDPTLSLASLRHWQTVLQSVSSLLDPRLSPIFQPVRGLPPMLLLAGADELWRDDAVRLANGVQAVGGKVSLNIHEGMWHVWPMTGEMPETDRAIDQFAEFLAGNSEPDA